MKNNTNYTMKMENTCTENNANEEMIKVFSKIIDSLIKKDRSLKIKKAREKRVAIGLENPLATQ